MTLNEIKERTTEQGPKKAFLNQKLVYSLNPSTFSYSLL